MREILQNIWTGLTTASPLDLANFMLGVVGVGLMIRRSLWAFPVGLVAVSVQGVLFFRAKFYADATLQIFFFVALAWGWWHWLHGKKADEAELPVTVLSWHARLATLALTALATVAWALAMRAWTDAAMPWRDAIIAALQVAGQVLQARKKIENWALFTAANLVAIPAYWSAEMAYTAFLFAIYLVLGLMGWRAWLVGRRKGAGGGAGDEAGAQAPMKSHA